MRIAKTEDGRYVKVIDPQMQGLIGRLYQEIRERKAHDTYVDSNLLSNQQDMVKNTAQIETMAVRYANIIELLGKLFPEDELYANIDRDLIVDGTVKGYYFISTTTSGAPMIVSSSTQVDKLNVEFLQGKTPADFQKWVDDSAAAVTKATDDKFHEADLLAQRTYAPIAHVGSRGIGVHDIADYTDAGFMSPLDKRDIDDLKTRMTTAEAELNKIDVGTGFIASNTEPDLALRKKGLLWVDLN